MGQRSRERGQQRRGDIAFLMEHAERAGLVVEFGSLAGARTALDQMPTDDLRARRVMEEECLKEPRYRRRPIITSNRIGTASKKVSEHLFSDMGEAALI